MNPSRFPPELLSRIEQSAVVAVLVIDDAAHAVPVAEALLAGGVRAMELTMRTPAALDALRAIRTGTREMMAGVGTVLTPDAVRAAQDAGAQFAVAPGFNRRVVEAAGALDLPFAPGIATPSELEGAIELGCRQVKLFPAEPLGGLRYLKSLAAPYAHLGIRYVPLGGVSEQNLSEWLSSPHVLAVGGSWLATRELIANQRWDEITARAAAACRIAEQART